VRPAIARDRDDAFAAGWHPPAWTPVLDDLEALLRMTNEPHPARRAPRPRRILDEVQRADGRTSATSSSSCCSRCWPTATSCSKTCPGVAKTLIARSFAAATGLRFGRVQFTPDLLPSDVTGSSVFDQRTASFEFRPAGRCSGNPWPPWATMI